MRDSLYHCPRCHGVHFEIRTVYAFQANPYNEIEGLYDQSEWLICRTCQFEIRRPNHA